jgi:Caspase domain
MCTIFRSVIYFGLCCIFGVVTAHAQSGLSVSVLYKRLSEQSTVRTDSAVQSALLTLEEKMIEAGLSALQPDAALYAQLDQAASFVVNFDEDSGLVLLLDAAKSLRPYEGTELTYAELRLRARLFSGTRIVATANGQGQIAFRTGAHDKAFEAAGRRAATLVAQDLLKKLASMEATTLSQGAANLSPQALPAPASVTPAAVPSKRFAILFGVGDFSRALQGLASNLPDTVADVVLMKTRLLQRGVPSENIIELKDAQATTAALRNALQSLQGRTKVGDQVILFIASHGMPKDEGRRGFGFPVTYDTNLAIPTSVIDFEEIRQFLTAQSAKQVVFMVDTCHSGGAAVSLPTVEFSKRGVKSVRSSGAVAPSAAVAGLLGKDFVVITAAREEQLSMGDGKNGIFTRALSDAVERATPNQPLYQLYKSHLEIEVPRRRREIEKCNPCSVDQTQQPGFAYAGAGIGVGL